MQPVPVRATFLIAVAALVACGSEGTQNPVKDAFVDAPKEGEVGAPVAFRFPTRRGNDTKLYRLPEFEEVNWTFETSRSPAEQVVGFAADQDLVYYLTEASQLVALDLTSGRIRVVDSTVALAAMSPVGTPVLVRVNGSVASVSYRTAVPWTVEFVSAPSAIWVGARERLIALVSEDGGRILRLHANGQNPISQLVPNGDVSVSMWGDAAAVATDSGIALIDPDDPDARRFLPFARPPQFVVFSPSAHRVYAADDGARLYGIDWNTMAVVDSLTLPGTAVAARVDPWGRTLLLRPAMGDSVWVVDGPRWVLEQTVEGEWEDELPLVAPDGSILIRRGDQVVSLSRDPLEVVGTTADPRGDRWIVAAWDPRRPALESAMEGVAETQQASQAIYVQVSSTSNPEWAADLAANLGRAGMQASVLPPERDDEPYRVVLGPYPSREEAEATRRRLNMPSWIFTQDTSRTRP
jgi:hypothetical protein